MEQTLYKQSDTEASDIAEPEHEPVFNERELVLERFANTPMAYIVNGTPHKARGSYEAVMLCEFLQNEKLPAAFLEVKFQEGAALIAALDVSKPDTADIPTDNEQDLPADMRASAVTDTASSKEGSGAESQSKSNNSKSSSGEAATPDQRTDTSPSDPDNAPIPIEKISPASNVKSGSKVIEQPSSDAREAKNTKEEPTNELLLPIMSLQAESAELTSADDSQDEHLAEGPTVDEFIESDVNHAKHQEVPVPSDAPIDAILTEEEISIPEPIEVESTDTEIAQVNIEDVDKDNEEPEEVDVAAFEPIDMNTADISESLEMSDEHTEEQTVLDDLSEGNPLETFSIPHMDDIEEMADTHMELEADQDADLNNLNELLIELSTKYEGGETNEDEPEEPARINQLYECLEAQVQEFVQSSTSEVNEEVTLAAIQNVLKEIADEAGIENTELLAELYLRQYGISGLFDITQLPAASVSQNDSRWVAQYSKIAQYVMQQLVRHEKTPLSDTLLFANVS